MSDRGITSYAAYIPRLRMARSSIAAAHAWAMPGLKAAGKGERAFCSWDEDAITMSVDAVRADGAVGIAYDLLLFGNEAADSGDYQVPIRVAAALDLPWLTGIKAVDVTGDAVRARRDGTGGQEVYELPLPAVLAVRDRTRCFASHWS